MITKIVSGGQTGVDRAALDVAMELNIPHGGWCPKGRCAENGTIPEKYLLKETDSSEYSERTKLNIRDSDGTLILVLENPTQVKGGTKLTIQEAREKNKPYLVVDLSEGPTSDVIMEWINKNNIKVLNIAGPRESQSPGIYQLSFTFLEKTLAYLLNTASHDSNSHTEQKNNPLFRAKL